MRAEIYIEDAEDGPGAHVCFVFPGGPPNPESHAHQMANVIRQQLDKLARDGVLTAQTAGEAPALEA